MARPMPRVPPVTIAFLPLRSRSTFRSFRLTCRYYSGLRFAERLASSPHPSTGGFADGSRKRTRRLVQRQDRPRERGPDPVPRSGLSARRRRLRHDPQLQRQGVPPAEHVARLYRSLKYLDIDPGLPPAEMVAISEDVLARNRHLLGAGEDYWLAQRISRGINRVPGDNWDHYGPNVIVECVPLPLRERAKHFRDGIDVVTPSLRRTPPNSLSPRAKMHQYLNLVLADREVKAQNPDAWAVLLDVNGNLSEGQGSNIFLVRDGRLLTPRERYVLPGVSRQAVIDLARRLDIPFEETGHRPLRRLYRRRVLSDFDQPVHLRGAQPERPNLCRRRGAGADHPAADRGLQGAGRLRFRRAIPAAARRLNGCRMRGLVLAAALALLALGPSAAPHNRRTTTPNRASDRRDRREPQLRQSLRHLPAAIGQPRCTICCRRVSSTATAAPDRNFTQAAQRRAEVRETYEVTPRIVGTYGELPRPGTTYAVGQPRYVPDERFPALLPNGPFQITKHSSTTPRRSATRYTASSRCGSKSMAAAAISSSGSPRLRARARRTAPIRHPAPTRARSRWGFYNMAAGDAPYFRQLADNYALSDNHHQPVMGGTGANFQALATGHAIAYWKDGALGRAAAQTRSRTRTRGPAPTTGTRIRATRAAPTPNCSDPDAARGRKRSGPIWRALPYRASTTAIASPAPIIWSTITMPDSPATGETGAAGTEE